ncbi:MAG: lipid A export permease/ATP-binding protein MsbA [Nitrosospira sp.]|nr:lipid A export permease/ATP-binding protein MsbA [Nitrosospira sp.]
MNSRKLYSRLIKYIAPYWEVLIFAFIGMMVMAATAPMLAALMEWMVDGALVSKDMEVMQLVLLGIIVLFIVRGAAGYVSTYAISWIGSKLVVDLRVEMFDKLLTLPARIYADQSSGRLMSRFRSDIDQLARAFTAVVTVMVKDTLTVIGLLGWILYLNWKLSVLALVVASVIVLIIRWVNERLQKMGREGGQKVDDIAQVLKESIENHKLVKLYGGEQYENQRMRELVSRAHSFTMKQVAIAAFAVPLVQMITAVALAIILYYATQQVSVDEITAGSFVSLILSMLMLSLPLKRVAGVNARLQHGLAAAESIFSLLDEETESNPGTIAIERVRGELRFEQVSFKYGTQSGRSHFESSTEASPAESLDAGFTLRDITLTIQPGETVALVGFSGCGKAALTDLVPRFFHPTEGRILLDGHDLASLTLTSLRANIVLVSQDMALFNDTIAANIAYGAMGRATEGRITAAAQAAHAMEFIREMSHGLQTLVGEQGVSLTGGQRLRIAIARALLRNSPVLILDETYQTLDFESSQHVRMALEAVMQGRTTLVITQRLSTLEKASRVAMLQKGRIAEIGSHGELLAKGGAYASLIQTLWNSAGHDRDGPR